MEFHHTSPHDASADGRSAGTLRSRLRWTVTSWIFVLTAIGVVQIVRVQWFDAAAFFVAAAAVTADALRPRSTARPRRTPRAWLLGVAVVAAAVLCLLPRHSVPMQALVIGVGAASVVLAWQGGAVTHPDRPVLRTRGIRILAIAWAATFIAGCIWELIQFILGLVHPQATTFALSDLLNPAVATFPGRLVFIAGWIAGGVWLLHRGGRR